MGIRLRGREGHVVDRGGLLAATMGEQAASQNHWLCNKNEHICALEGILGDLAGAKVEVKAGVGEVNGGNAARNKPEKK